MSLKEKINAKRKQREIIRTNYKWQKQLDLDRRDGESAEDFEKRKKAHHHRERQLKGKLHRIVNRIKRLVKRLKDKQQPNIVISAGSPHWGGCEDIVQNEVVPVGQRWGIPATSGKRSETYGNPSSDHYTGNTTASARDFATASNYAFGAAIGDSLGVPYNGYGSDYQSYTISRAGRLFRVQIICQTHGTGPHTHCGIKLI